MPNNDEKLLAALSDPAFVSMDDASVVAALNAPIYTLRDANDPTYKIDVMKVGAILGATKATMIRAGLLQAAANVDPSIAAAAGYALDVLRGPGFSPSNADAQTMAQMFVAMGILSADDAKTLLNTVSYRIGRSDVTADEVNAGRASLAVAQAELALEQKIIGAYNAAMALAQGGETDLTKIQTAFDATLAEA